MKKSKFNEAQIMNILKEAQGGIPVANLCRQHDVSTATFYKWRSKYGGMDVSMISRMKALEEENRRLKKMYAEVREAIAGTKNLWLKRLLTAVVDDPAIAPKFKRAPAAMTMHHAFIGGLLEHVVSLIGLSRGAAAHYPELDSDLLLTGIVLHDIGKIDELRYTRAFDYTTVGRLLGHINIGVSMVRDKIRAIPNFPVPLAVLVEHLIVSHHGTHEFGSPALPQTREAVALHFFDDMDSKMAAMRATFAAPAEPDAWTERNPALRRALLRTDQFLADEESNRAAAAANPKSPSRKG